MLLLRFVAELYYIVFIWQSAHMDCYFGSFVGESMHDDGSLVFAYYKDGATDPTFLYFAYGLKEVKC